MKTSSHKSVFNLKEAAAYLGISVPTLVRLLGSGAIPYLCVRCVVKNNVNLETPNHPPSEKLTAGFLCGSLPLVIF